MKKITSLSFLSAIVMAIGVMTFSSCTKDATDACANVTCVNGTTTTVGTTCSCECTDGYFGSSCSTAYNTLFIGNWRVTNETTRQQGTTTDVPTDAYTDTIIAGSGATVTSINNFSGYLATANLHVDTTKLFQNAGDTFRTSYISGTDEVFIKIYNFNGTFTNSTKNQIQYTYGLTTNVGTGAGTNFSAVGTLVKQ